MRTSYASGRSTLPAPQLGVTPTGSGESRTMYFAIVGENPAGINQLGAIASLTLPANGNDILAEVEITLPAGYRRAGEFWESYVVAASLSNDPTTFVQLCKIPALDEFGQPRSFPLSLTLNEPAHFALNAIAATPSTLPVEPLHGQVRRVTNLGGQLFEFVQGSGRPANNSTILDALDGRWLLKPGTASAYVQNTTDGGGCDRPLELVGPSLLRAPRYAMGGGDGTRRTYWITNDTNEPIPAGFRVGLAVEVDGTPMADAFAGMLVTVFHGFSQADGNIRTTYLDAPAESFPRLNLEQYWPNSKSGLILPDDLQPGESLALTIFPRFRSAQLSGNALLGGIVTVRPSLFSQAGAFSEVGEALGNQIYASHDRGLVVPIAGSGIRVLKRSGIVNDLGFRDIGASDLTAQPNQANQNVAINGNGAVYLINAIDPNREALRAVVSCGTGVSNPSPWSDPFAVTDGTATLTLTHPISGQHAVIRSSYPDSLIAGLQDKAELNAPYLRVYLRAGSAIREFGPYAVIAGETQQIAIADWNVGETVGAVPEPPNERFGLFDPVSVSGVGGVGGTVPLGVYECCWVYDYVGAAVTEINHSAAGAIHTAGQTWAEMESSTLHWGTPIAPNLITTLPRQMPWHSRRLTDGGLAYYDPTATETPDNQNSWLPSWIPGAAQPGRWRREQGGAGGGGGVNIVTDLDALSSLQNPQNNSVHICFQPNVAGSGGGEGPAWYIFRAESDLNALGNIVVNRTSGDGQFIKLSNLYHRSASSPTDPPPFRGIVFHNASMGAFWLSIGDNHIEDWLPFGNSPVFSYGIPGMTTPAFKGQFAYDEGTNVLFMAEGTTSFDWISFPGVPEPGGGGGS